MSRMQAKRFVKKDELFMQLWLRTLCCTSLPYSGYFGVKFSRSHDLCINNYGKFSRVKFRGSRFLEFHLLTFTKGKLAIVRTRDSCNGDPCQFLQHHIVMDALVSGMRANIGNGSAWAADRLNQERKWAHGVW